MHRSIRSSVVLVVLWSGVAAACTGEPAPASDPAAAAASAREPGSPDQAAAVAAALVDPREFLRVHNLAEDPRAPDWPAAVEQLALAGDGFSLGRLRALAERDLDLDPERAATLANAIATLEARLGGDDALAVSRIVPLLERAAYADLMCDPMEAHLPAWTFERLAGHLDDPAVRAELERLTRGHEPTWDVETLFSTMAARVPDYARQVLAQPTSAAR